MVLFSTSNSLTFSDGSQAGYTGSPGDDLNTCVLCHSVSPSASITPYSYSLTTDIDEYYIPGNLYHIIVDVLGPGIDKFGFQTCFENEEGQKVGEIILADSIQTKLISNGNYITHTSNGIDGSGLGSKSWDFYWRAPLTVQGKISVYSSVLLSGDSIMVLSESESFSEPILGCLDPDASNFNEQVTTDDGSCLYEFFSSASFLSLSFDSLTINGDILNQELLVNFSVHNNSDSNLDVYVLRNILSDNVPENWREGTTFLAAAIFAGNCLTLGSDGNEFGPFFFFICLNMVALYAVSEGVIGNIWRYNLLVGGLMGVIFAGAGTFFGYEPPEALMPLQLVLWITFILGLGVGPLLAWRDR